MTHLEGFNKEMKVNQMQQMVYKQISSLHKYSEIRTQPQQEYLLLSSKGFQELSYKMTKNKYLYRG